MKNNLALMMTLAIAAALVSPAAADEIKHDGLNYPGVRIIGLRDGHLLYETIGGVERSVPLEIVEAIKINAYPELTKADEAIAAGKWAEAANVLRPLADKVREDYLKTLVRGKLVVALDRSGRYEEAVRQYLMLLKQSGADAFIQAAMPKNPPQAAAERDRVRKLLEGELQVATAEPTKQAITALLAPLKPEAAPAAPGAGKNAPATPAAPADRKMQPPAPAAAPAPVPGPGAGPAVLVGEQPQPTKNSVADLLAAGRHADALVAIEAQVNGGLGEMSLLLHQRGMAQAALGQDQDALVSFMRVVIHFPRSASATAARIEAGKLFVKLNQPQHARNIWAEGHAIAKGTDDAAAAQIQTLLDALPK